MTDLTSGNARTPAMTGSLDGFTAELTTALNRLDRERRSSFARPGQRAEATDRFMQAVTKAVERVRGTDRVTAAAIRAADLDTAKRDHATITALERQLAQAVTRGSRMQDELANVNADLAATNARWAERTAELERLLDSLRDELTETRASLQGDLAIAHSQGRADEAAHVPVLLAEARTGLDTAPEPPLEAPAPPLPQRRRATRQAPDGPRNDADGQTGPPASVRTPKRQRGSQGREAAK